VIQHHEGGPPNACKGCERDAQSNGHASQDGGKGNHLKKDIKECRHGGQKRIEQLCKCLDAHAWFS